MSEHSLSTIGLLMTGLELEQLIDIAKHDVWDGNLISKISRDQLVEWGLVSRIKRGVNRITSAGLTYLQLHK